MISESRSRLLADHCISRTRRERGIQIFAFRFTQRSRRSHVWVSNTLKAFDISDIIERYFVHGDEYAGLSAFVNEPAKESDRNALMLAVGALVPLSYGRLGKSWKHAAGLKELAK